METFKKSEIVVQQLRDAIKLLKEYHCVSAVTLSNAASKILSQLCRKRGLPFTHTFEVSAANKMDAVPPKNLERFVNSTVNHTANILKHHDTAEDEAVSAEFYFEAVRLINGSLENYKTLFGEYPSGQEFSYFLESIIEPAN
jgi:hypothetical protein